MNYKNMNKNSRKTKDRILEENKQEYDKNFNNSKQLIPRVYNEMYELNTISPSTRKELYKKFVNEIISLEDNEDYLNKVATVLGIERKRLDVIDIEESNKYERDDGDYGFELKKKKDKKTGGCEVENINVTTRHLRIDRVENNKNNIIIK